MLKRRNGSEMAERPWKVITTYSMPGLHGPDSEKSRLPGWHAPGLQERRHCRRTTCLKFRFSLIANIV